MSNKKLHIQQKEEARFWAKIEKQGLGCWIWLGAKTKAGFGRFKFRGKLVLSHRFAYKICCEDVPDDVWIIRKADCLTPGCCNPKHLTVGDRSQAVSHGVKRGTVVLPETYLTINTELADKSVSRRKFAPSQIKDIRQELALNGSVSKLAKSYGVDKHTIYSIKNARHYKDIEDNVVGKNQNFIWQGMTANGLPDFDSNWTEEMQIEWLELFELFVKCYRIYSNPESYMKTEELRICLNIDVVKEPSIGNKSSERFHPKQSRSERAKTSVSSSNGDTEIFLL